jgi:hypothetical protein
VSATLEVWTKAVFDHPVRKREWYWDGEFDAFWNALEMSDSLTVEYMTRLFSDSHVLQRYSHEQVAQGIWFLVGESSPGKIAYALLNPDVDLDQRIGCLHAVTNFFETFVVPLGRVADTENNPLHIACYMWWDIFPTDDGQNFAESELHAACLKVMAEILSLPSELCQLSALHGLNHWHSYHAERVEEIVAAFLNRTAGLSTRILQYAALAGSGTAQ